MTTKCISPDLGSCLCQKSCLDITNHELSCLTNTKIDYYFYILLISGQLIHADKHGFLVIPEEDEEKLLEASDYMDMMERKLVLVPGREGIFAMFLHIFAGSLWFKLF